MGDPAVGWIAAIIIGGIAGWLAEQFMKSDMGLLMNIVLGIVGAAACRLPRCGQEAPDAKDLAYGSARVLIAEYRADTPIAKLGAYRHRSSGVELSIRNRAVVGSNPTGGSQFFAGPTQEFQV